MSPGLPALKDLSREGREAFLDTWEPVLWAYWSEAFSDALTSGERWLRASEARAAGRDDRQAGQWIAGKILEALRTRPRLDFARDWTNLPGWYAWWVGSQAVAAQLRASTFTPLDEERTGTDPGSSEDALEDALVERLDSARRMEALLALVDEWARILGRIAASTELPDIEADWLWATCVARRDVARLLAAVGVGDERFRQVDKSLLAARTSESGDEARDRTKRSRRGTAAAFRFNLEALLPGHPELAPAHRVFLGPIRDAGEAPPCPALPVTAKALHGFRETVRQSASADAFEGPLSALWSKVLRVAVKKAVARLLPPGPREQVERDWKELVGTQVIEEQE